jgi:NitT/TauT family transport system permease protein
VPQVFAGLLTAILFGLRVENVVLRLLEQRPVVRWGMKR